VWHLLTSGKYYLFSVLFHVFLITLLSVFVLSPAGKTSLQAQGSQEGVIRVSLNQNFSAAAPGSLSQSVFRAESSVEKNIRESIESSANNDSNSDNNANEKKYQGDFESNIESIQQGSYGTGFFRKAYLLSELIPVYPANAVRRGLEGTVLIDVSIDSSGRVFKTEIITSSNYDILDRAAIRCVRRARFAPASYMGRPTADVLRIAVNFSLN